MTRHLQGGLRPIVLALLTVSLLLGGTPSDAQAGARKHDPKRAAWIRAHYTKFEHRIPMRDGARLFTAVYTPNKRRGAMPLLILRTPYSVGPYGADRYPDRLGPYPAFEKEGFIFVMQDVRGRFMSEGAFVNMRPQVAGRRGPKQVDESSDAYDTITWLLKNVTGHNGKVGLRGISYPGFYAAAGAIQGHPALKAVAPQAPIADWFWDDMHHNGALMLQMTFGFFSGFGQARPELTTEWPKFFEFPTPDAYRFFLDLGPLSNIDARHYKGKISFWKDVVAHPNYDDYWRSRSILPHLNGIKAAVLVVGGWYDAEDLYGPLKIHRAIAEQNPRANLRLVMGPWSHGGWVRTGGDKLGDSSFGFETSAYYKEHIELAFFKQHLKGAKTAPAAPVLAFETGANRWRELDAWPPKEARLRTFYLGADGALSQTKPIDAGPAHDAWISDPAKPVPYTMKLQPRMAKPYMSEDQRFAAYRPDVMVYRSDVLSEDLTVAGPIAVKLWVSTSQTAADFVVKVIDEVPGRVKSKGQPDPEGGKQLMIRGDIMRGRYRQSFSKPLPFVANEPAAVDFELLDLFHTFKRGHRLVVHVQSTWFPLADRNPQRYVPNIYEAKAADFVKAEHRLYRSAAMASRLVFAVLP